MYFTSLPLVTELCNYFLSALVSITTWHVGVVIDEVAKSQRKWGRGVST